MVRDTKDHVYLLDFAPFNEKWSEPLAFEWDELTVDDEVVISVFTLRTQQYITYKNTFR